MSLIEINVVCHLLFYGLETWPGLSFRSRPLPPFQVAKRLMHVTLGKVSNDQFADLCHTRCAVCLQCSMNFALHALVFASMKLAHLSE